jgi:hypothetical protein
LKHHKVGYIRRLHPVAKRTAAHSLGRISPDGRISSVQFRNRIRNK